MLELLNTDACKTISRPNRYVLQFTDELFNLNPASISYAEFGVGIGATTLEVAKKLREKDEIHIFDFEESVLELKRDLNDLGYQNIRTYGNTKKYWDSYNWSLAKIISNNHSKEMFDLVYIDGAHTFQHDALCFFLSAILLRPGGFIIFDDYEWSYSVSKYMSGTRDQYMTQEQIESKQIKLVVDSLLKGHPGFNEVIENQVFQKKLP